MLGNTGDNDMRPIDTKGSRTGWQAHHIIPAGHPDAAPARITGFRCHVHPNSKLNGLWLRGSTRLAGTPGYDRLTADQRQRVAHRRTFTRAYLDRVNNVTAAARTGRFGCDEDKAKQLLEGIDHQLANGVEEIFDSAHRP